MKPRPSIEWTDATWNPIRGCSRVAHRFSGAGQPYEGLAHQVNGHAAWTGKVALEEKRLLDPLRWGTKIVLNPECPENRIAGAHGPGRADCICRQRPRRIFVNSMFHENVPDEWIDRIFAVMALCPQHTFQVLTKRPERMLKYLRGEWPLRVAEGIYTEIHGHRHNWTNTVLDKALRRANTASAEIKRIVNAISVDDREPQFALPNVQLGVSVEDQKTADERIPLLLQTPAAVRFISAEPLLGAITFRWAKWDDWSPNDRRAKQLPAVERDGRLKAGCVNEHDGLRMLDWVIFGGESGPGARPMHPDWARSLRDQCVAAGVPFFFKQWGAWAPLDQNRGLGWKFGDERTGFWAEDSPGFYEWHHKGVSSHGEHMLRVGKKAAGALLDGHEWKEFPL